MKKTILSALLLSLLLSLAACGAKQGGTPSASSSGGSASVSSSAPDVSSAGASSGDTSSGLTPLTTEELTAAHEAAYAYYKDTVFEVQTLTEIAPRDGEISFQVACTKGGTPQDPDRVISLERQDGVWVVVNEGY